MVFDVLFPLPIFFFILARREAKNKRRMRAFAGAFCCIIKEICRAVKGAALAPLTGFL